MLLGTLGESLLTGRGMYRVCNQGKGFSGQDEELKRNR